MIFDLHNDFLTSPEFQSLEKVGVKTAFSENIVYAVWTTELADAAAYLSHIAALNGAKGLRYLAVEDLSFLRPSLCPSEEEVSQDFAAVKALKPVYASLTWNSENLLAGGAHTDAGLTDFGRQVLRFLVRNGILPDFAHLSRPAFFQAADEAERLGTRIICSHTCFDGVYPHRRNLTDEQIKLITERGGLIGLCFVAEFMGKSTADSQDVIRQIDYFTAKFGANNLAIGSDFFGTDSPAIENYAAIEALKSSLAKMGYAAQDINNIFYQNAKNFLEKDKF